MSRGRGDSFTAAEPPPTGHAAGRGASRGAGGTRGRTSAKIVNFLLFVKGGGVIFYNGGDTGVPIFLMIVSNFFLQC